MTEYHITIKKIIEQYLKTNGYDGLARDECGCHLGDLAPCGEFPFDCMPGHSEPCGCGDDGQPDCKHVFSKHVTPGKKGD